MNKVFMDSSALFAAVKYETGAGEVFDKLTAQQITWQEDDPG